MGAEIIPLAKHHWDHCKRVDCPGCMLCHGGLALCTVCRGLEGSLPTDCPGEQMGDEVAKAVYAGERDFVRGRGWIEGASPNSPAAYRSPER